MRLHAHHIIAVILVVLMVLSSIWWILFDEETIEREEWTPSELPSNETVIYYNGAFVCDAWIAATEAERSQGLIGTEENDTRGMLFIFDTTSSTRTFHMQGMSYSIDIIFMDGEKRVVDIYAEVPPEEDGGGAHTTYSSSVPVAYTLEIVAGRAEELNIMVGSELEWPL
ncbi:MAG: DUF192 domain-containing protein [Thermoplasmata archaeon]|nr:DUF192 domain-containing protein [Thermoplasmata archaeon]